ncbi:alpha-tubulin suppressor-like RCC1 family protein/ubiquitin [Paenibacillus sp. 1182]|uniref:RCC1 domain-containing protein n=1 Tax=Paenibacillus sp. 1182 TaxID=2806565 RepID=UPI001AE1E5DD|nr:protease epr [Paenibacillus sp. 1182]MBP1309299.1 alpha-tubulin suppressor-like RCC1 family protein/ubiquitin [Paenibacillus sp. 1182]
MRFIITKKLKKVLTAVMVPLVIVTFLPFSQKQIAHASELPSTFISIAAGDNFAMAIASDKTLWAWGSNSGGALGIGRDSGYETKPVQVLNMNNVKSVSLSGSHSLALKEDGTVWGWGSNRYGQTGVDSADSQKIPVQVAGLSNVIAVSAGSSYSLALKSDGTVWAWGANNYGQLGNGTIDERAINPSPRPQKIPSLSGIQMISAGTYHALALTKSGTLWGWGRNEDGSLNRQGATASAPTPFQLANGFGYNIIFAEAGHNSTLYGLLGSDIYNHGNYINMLLSQGRNLSSTIYDYKDVSSNYHTLIVKYDGTLWGWGDNESGQVGDGTYNKPSEPVQSWPNLLSDVKSAAAGYKFSLVLKNDGTLWSWGANDRGQLGIGNTNNQYKPQPVKIEETDTVPPNIELKLSNTDPTKEDLKVTVNVTDEKGIAQIKWAMGEQTAAYFKNGGSDITATPSFIVSANGVYTVWAKDTSENENVKNIVVENIDKTPPTNPSVVVSGNIMTIVPGNDSFGIDKTLYQLNDGGWISYTGVVTLVDGSYTIRAKSVDKVGNESAVTTISATVNEQATAAVELAEMNPTQSRVDTAQALVNALPNSTNKTALQARLKQVQSHINQYNAIQTEINTINTTVNKGSLTKEVVNQYKQRIDELYVLVDSLPTTMDIASLNKQLDELKNKLILIGKILELINNESIKEVDLGKLEDEIKKLPDGDLKDDLQTHIDQAKNLQDAIKKVEQAEQSKSQKDVDSARDAVHKLQDGKVKDELLKRVDEVQNLIHAGEALAKQIEEATKKVEKAEVSKTQTDVNAARDAVSKLPEGQVKKQLNDRLDAVQDLIDDQALEDLIADATKKVEAAEQSKRQLDVDAAREKVNQLPTGKIKTELSDRLDLIQKQIDDVSVNPIDEAVKKAEKTRSQVDVNTARDIVNTLPNGAEQDAYHKRLDAVDEALKAATVKVGQAENYQRDPYVTEAQNVVEALKESPAKQTLQDRLDTVTKAISDKAYKDQLDKAIQKVEQAELYKRDPYIKNAYDAVNALPDGTNKSELLDRLDQIGKGTSNPGGEKDGQFNPGDHVVDVAKTIKDSEAKRVYVEWAESVERAEKYFSKGNIVFALNKMNAIPTAIGENSKYNSLYVELKNRSEILKKRYNDSLSSSSLDLT